MNLFNCFVLVLVSLGAVLVSADNIREVSAVVGHSYGLNFDYRGPTYYIRYYFTKDGRSFRADGRRIFQKLGRIYFSKFTSWDAAVYRMVVTRGYKKIYEQAIKLTGKHNHIDFNCIAS